MKNLIALFFFLFLVVSCSNKTDQEYFDQATKELKENKVTAAIATLQTLLIEHPKSKLGAKALIQIASIYESEKVPNKSRKDSFDSAQKFLMEVYEKYPSDAEAPNALFKCAFILANELEDYDKATKVYKLFIEKYPDHEYAAIAKDELDIMGIPPEDLLKRVQSANK